MRAFAVVVAASLLLTGCPAGGPQAPVAPKPERVDHLILGIQQEPDKLNTALNAMVYGTYIGQAIYGYLVKYDDQMNLVPHVAVAVPTLENGGISADSLTYTYKLREGVRWHDGAPFTSADVAFTVEVIMDPRHEIESRVGYDKIAAVATPDAHTVVVTLKEPFAPFSGTFLFAAPIMPKHILEPHVGPEFSKAPFHRAPIGVGPFKFKEWVPGSHVSVERNDDYFGGPPALREVTFKFITDANTLLVGLQSGQVDGYDNAGTDHHELLKGLPGVQVYVTPALMWEHLDLNTEDPVLADIRVRQAVQLAIDRDQISQGVYGGLWPPALGDVRPDLPWYNPAIEGLVRTDPAAAGALLDAAGWTMGDQGLRWKDGASLTLTVSTTSGRPQRELTEQVLQQQLRAVGIDLRIENHNASALFAPFQSGGVLKSGRYQLGMYAWITSPDPDRQSLYHSTRRPETGGQNHPRINNPDLDALLDAGVRELRPEKRKELYDRVQALIATEVPMTPLVWRADLDPMTKRLKGYRPNPTQTGDTWNIADWSLAAP